MVDTLDIVNRQSLFSIRDLDEKVEKELLAMDDIYGGLLMTDEERVEFDKVALPKYRDALKGLSVETLLVFEGGATMIPGSVGRDNLIKKEISRRISEAANGSKEFLDSKFFETMLFSSEDRSNDNRFDDYRQTAYERNMYVKENKGKILPDDIEVYFFEYDKVLTGDAKKAFDNYKEFQSNKEIDEIILETESQKPIDKTFDLDELKAFAKENPDFDIDISGIDTLEKYEEAIKKMKDMKDQNGKEEEGKNPESDAPKKEEENLEFVSENFGDAPENEDNEWIEDCEKYWEEWCADESRKFQPPVVDKTKNGYAFDIYKSEADRQAGKKYGHIHYQSKTSVHIESDSYEVWKGVIDKAIIDKQGLSVKNMDPKTNEKAIKMVMIAATIAGAKDKLVGVPEGMVITDEDMKALGIAPKEQALYKKMLDGDVQSPSQNEPAVKKSIYERMTSGEEISGSEAQLIDRISYIRIAKKANENAKKREEDQQNLPENADNVAGKSMEEIIVEKRRNNEKLSEKEIKFIGSFKLDVARDLELPEGENSVAKDRMSYLEKLSGTIDKKLEAKKTLSGDELASTLTGIDKDFGAMQSFKTR